MKSRKILFVLFSLFASISVPGQNCYVGTTMEVALYLQNTSGIVYKEDGLPKNPFQSVKDHGGTIVRFRLDLPPFTNSYIVNEPPVDYRSPEKVKESMQAAKDAGLKTILTFSYQSFALEAEEALNPYIAPLGWQSIASDVTKLADSIYNYTYKTVATLVEAGLVPEIVAVGNETNWRILEPNLPENQLPDYDPQRTVTLLNAGTSAIRDINQAFELQIKIALHIFRASNLTWWMDTHVPLGLDFDIMGLSHYHAWHNLGSFSNWSQVVNWVQSHYQKDFMIMETAQLFSSGYSDDRANVLGTENIPAGYPNPPTIETQKQYLTDFANEILDAGGLGVIVWGGDWVGSDCYVLPDQYGPGSSWENKAFWDFENNLHEGIDWMKESCPHNSVGENLQDPVITVFPVPVTSNSITLESNAIRINDIEIYSLYGQKMESLLNEDKNSGQIILTFTDQTPKSGMYIIRIDFGNGKSLYRMIPVLNNK
jgi:arabinogalactan endo-1,4-beta-galactosidase